MVDLDLDPETPAPSDDPLTSSPFPATSSYQPSMPLVDADGWQTFHFEGGLSQFVAWTNEGKHPLHDPIVLERWGCVEERNGRVTTASLKIWV